MTDASELALGRYQLITHQALKLMGPLLAAVMKRSPLQTEGERWSVLDHYSSFGQVTLLSLGNLENVTNQRKSKSDFSNWKQRCIRVLIGRTKTFSTSHYWWRFPKKQRMTSSLKPFRGGFNTEWKTSVTHLKLKHTTLFSLRWSTPARLDLDARADCH